MLEQIVGKAIQSVQNSLIAFCKFITPNDTGETGSHQSGFHIHKNAWPLVFDTSGLRGENKDRFIKIWWQGDFETTSRFTYYGKGSRNEYRLTRFNRNFPFLSSDFIGSLFVLSKLSPDSYEAYVLITDDEIETFLDGVGISVSQTNSIIPRPSQKTVAQSLQDLFDQYISQTKIDFPTTEMMSQQSRKFYNYLNNVNDKAILKGADKYIINWIETEFALFKSFEMSRYTEYLITPLQDMDRLVEVANVVLQRRKSRAGKSLENHLDYIFGLHNLQFERNAITENNKKPDFLFPSQSCYRDSSYPLDNLIVLGAKTTCKDRWRQIAGEANRIDIKYLCTLQQGNTDNQLTEMHDEGIRLVVPQQYIFTYPEKHRASILSIEKFINMVKTKQRLFDGSR